MKRKPRINLEIIRVALPDPDKPFNFHDEDCVKRVRLSWGNLEFEIVPDTERKALKFYEVGSNRLMISPCAANAFTITGVRV